MMVPREATEYRRIRGYVSRRRSSQLLLRFVALTNRVRYFRLK